MKSRQVRSYEVLLRAARLKESKASIELARAWQLEQLASGEAVMAAERYRDATHAREHRVTGKADLALGEYFLFGELCDALLEQVQRTETEQRDAHNRRIEAAELASSTKRFAAKVEEELMRRRHAVAAFVEDGRAKEGIELWLEAGSRM